MIRLENDEVLKTLTKTLTFVDAEANANAGGSTIALRERCSGELKITQFYTCILSQGQRQITPRGQILIVTKMFIKFNHTL